jgi:hypothetical protein
MIVILMTISVLIAWISVIYQTLALLIVAGGLGVIVGLLFGVAGVTFNVFMLAIAFVSELWIGDIDFGPFSLRVYLMVGLLIYLFLTLAIDRTSIFVSKQAQSLAVFYVIFTLWMILCRVAQGEDFRSIATKMMSTHGVALVIFILVQKLAGKAQDRHFLGMTILSTIIISSLFATMEQAGFVWALRLINLLRPVTSNAFDVSGEVARGAVSGLAPSSFAMSYQVVIALITLMILFIFPNRDKKNKMTLLIGLLLLGLTAWVIQERSTLVAFGSVVVLFIFWLSRVHLQNKDDKKKVFYNLVVLLVLGVLFFSYQVFSESVLIQGVGSRLTNLYDAGRVILIRQALTFGMNHWLWGGGPVLFLLTTSSDFSTYYQTAVPHNLFLNALVYYGVPGLILAFFFCFKLYKDSGQFLRAALDQQDLLTVGFVFALLAYLVNAQFHNASFVTGDPLMWWLVGILYSTPAVPVENKQTALGRLPQRFSA